MHYYYNCISNIGSHYGNEYVKSTKIVSKAVLIAKLAVVFK